MLTTLAATALMTTLLLSQPMSLHVFAKEGTYGFVDNEGVLRIPAQFDKALDFAENVAPAAHVEGTKVYGHGEAGPDCQIQALRWGYIDPKGEVVIPFRYDDARPFSEGRAAVLSGGKWGFIDTKGDWVASSQFEWAGDFHDGMARVRMVTNGPYGYIDKAGKLIVHPQFQVAEDFRDGVAVVGTSQTSAALLDWTGRVIAWKGWLTHLGPGMVAYGDSYRGPMGLMNTGGEIITSAAFDSVSAFSDSITAAKKAGRWTFIDQRGSPVAPISFVDAEGAIDEMSEGLASVKVGNQFGFVDRSGTMASSPQFVFVSKFSSGLAAACIEIGEALAGRHAKPERRCGFIDRTGRYMISPRFGDAHGFERGLAFVRDPLFDDRLAINQRGRIVLRPSWNDESRFEPYGNCQFPPPPAPPPPPPDYSVVVDIGSIPEGASVYLVPAWDWQKHQDGRQLLGDPEAISAYLVTQGLTPLQNIKLKAQVSMGVFQLQGERKIARVVVAADGPRQITVSF